MIAQTKIADISVVIMKPTYQRNIMNHNVRITQVALCAVVIAPMVSDRIMRRRNRKTHIEDCHEQITILVDALRREDAKSNYLMEIINEHGIGTEFDNIVINSLV